MFNFNLIVGVVLAVVPGAVESWYLSVITVLPCVASLRHFCHRQHVPVFSLVCSFILFEFASKDFLHHSTLCGFLGANGESLTLPIGMLSLRLAIHKSWCGRACRQGLALVPVHSSCFWSMMTIPSHRQCIRVLKLLWLQQ